MKHARPTSFEGRLRIALVAGSAVLLATAVTIAANISLNTASAQTPITSGTPAAARPPSFPPTTPSAAVTIPSTPPTSPSRSRSARPSRSPASPTRAAPRPTATTALTATRRITGTFDGGDAAFAGSDDLGDGGSEEGQLPLFELADGATLANVVIGAPAADGVHCLGSCTLRNVWWLDVGEDAATFKGSFAAQTMTVTGGGALHASNVVFQHNGPGTFVISDFQASDIGKLYRSCGTCSQQFARHARLSDVTVTGPLTTLVGINPNLGDTATIDRATLIGGSARTVCALFDGVTDGSSTQTADVPDGDACKATNITQR